MNGSEAREYKGHLPVLPAEVLHYLGPEEGDVIIDATVGEGGHSRLIAERLGPRGRLICCDIDKELIEIAEKNLSGALPRIDFLRSDYKKLPELLPEVYSGRPDGFLIDLGACSRHFNDPSRGFSFMKDGPLDMRFDRSAGLKASDLVNTLSRKELEKIFREFGEVRNAPTISEAIVSERSRRKITTTAELAGIIHKTVKTRSGKIDPATRVFQALRIAVNRELEGLKEFLLYAARALKSGGRLVVISFHSLEDRLTKEAFKYLASECVCPPSIPVCVCGKKKEVRILTARPVVPSDSEIKTNPRSRSAKLRACEKTGSVNEIQKGE